MEQYANNSVTTLSGTISNSVTSITVASAALFPSLPSFRIRIENELMLVTAMAGTTWTVIRAIEGSTAAAHTAGVDVKHILTAASLQQMRFGGNYHADLIPPSPSVYNDEFDTGVLDSKWIQYGTPDLVDVTTYKGYLYLADNDAVSCGIYQVYTAPTTFSFVTKVSYNAAAAHFNLAGIQVLDAPGTTVLGCLAIQSDGGSGALIRMGNTGAFFNSSSSNIGNYVEHVQMGTIYLMLQYDNANFYAYTSQEGINWYKHGQWGYGSAPLGRLALEITGFTNAAQAMFDFVRVFPSFNFMIGNT